MQVFVLFSTYIILLYGKILHTYTMDNFSTPLSGYIIIYVRGLFTTYNVHTYFIL